MSKYCLDSNILIQAKNGPYPFDIFPGFWSWLGREMDQGRIVSVKPVYNELASYGDELSEWVKNRRQYFVEMERPVQLEFSEVSVYVTQNYEQTYYAEFLAKADPWVIAYCRTNRFYIVTNETKVDAQSKKVKIPNVSRHFNVKCKTLKDVMRELECQF